MENYFYKKGSVMEWVLGLFAVCLVAYIVLFRALSLPSVPVPGSTLPFAGQTYNLAGSGVSGSATSITLTSLTIKQTGQPIQDADLGDTFYLTLEPGSNTKQEIIGCTTVGTNTGSSVILSGCSRGLSPVTPYTASTTLQFTHAGGSQVIFSDPPQLFNLYAALANTQTITGVWTFTNTAPPVYDTNPTFGSNSNALVNKAYVDALSIQGAATSTETNLGLVRLGTSVQAASSTASSTTGAPLVLLTRYATSSPGVCCWTNVIPVTNNAGQISALFTATSSQFSWSGLNSWSASSTFTGTTSIAASGVASSPLILNAIPYKFPAAQGASSTELATNGSGVLMWNNPPRVVLAQDGSTLSNSNGTLTTVKSVTIPANTIGANDSIHIVGHIAKTSGSTNQCRGAVGLGTGSATTSIFTSGENFGANTNGGMFELWISSRNSQASQQINGWNQNAGASPQVMIATGTTATVNLANQAYLQFQVADTAGGTDTCTYTGIFVEGTRINI